MMSRSSALNVQGCRAGRSFRSLCSLSMASAVALLVMTFFLPATVGVFSRYYVKFVLFALWFLFFTEENRRRSVMLVQAIRDRASELWLIYAWLIVLVLNMTFARGDAGYDSQLLTTFVMGSLWYLMGLAWNYDGGGNRQVLALVLLSCFSMTALIAIPTLWSQPGISRTVEVTASLQEEYFRRGVGNVATYMGYGILFPFLVGVALACRTSKLRVLCIAMLVVLVAAMLIASYAGVLLLFAMSLVLLWVLIRHPSIRSPREVIALVAGVAAISAAIFGLSQALASTPFAWVSTKLTNIVTGVSSEGLVAGDKSGRGERMEKSFASIVCSPLIGMGTGRYGKGDTAGGHSAWVDDVAYYGFLGAAPLFAFIAAVARRFFRCWQAVPRSPWYAGAFTGWLLFIIYGFMNPVTQPFSLYAAFLMAGLVGRGRDSIDQKLLTNASK